MLTAYQNYTFELKMRMLMWRGVYNLLQPSLKIKNSNLGFVCLILKILTNRFYYKNNTDFSTYTLNKHTKSMLLMKIYAINKITQHT